MNQTAAPPANDKKDIALPAFGALLVLIWFIPDLLRSPVVWSFQSVLRMENTAVIAAVTPALEGALLLLLFAVSGVWKKAYLGSFVVSALAAFALLVFGKPAFLVGPIPCLVLASLCLGVAVYFRHRHQKRRLFYACNALLPAALLGYALWAVVEGRYPAVYLAPLKLPVALFATLSAAGISLLLHIRK